MDRQFEITCTFPLTGENELDHAKVIAAVAPAIDELSKAASDAGVSMKVETRSYTPKAKSTTPRKTKETPAKSSKAAA